MTDCLFCRSMTLWGINSLIKMTPFHWLQKCWQEAVWVHECLYTPHVVYLFVCRSLWGCVFGECKYGIYKCVWWWCLTVCVWCQYSAERALVPHVKQVWVRQLLSSLHSAYNWFWCGGRQKRCFFNSSVMPDFPVPFYWIFMLVNE